MSRRPSSVGQDGTPGPLDDVVEVRSRLKGSNADLRTNSAELVRVLAHTRRLLDDHRVRFEALFEEAPTAYVVTDASGRIERLNVAAELLFGGERRFLEGKPIFAFFALPARAEIRRVASAVARDGGTPQLEATVVGRDRPQALVEVRFSRNWSGNGPRLVNWLIHDLSERVRGDEARRDRDRLDAMNRAKDELLGLVSHELRTPLTVIGGNADLLRRRGHTLSEDERHDLLDSIANESRRLRTVVANMLQLAHAEATVELEPVVVQRVVERCAAWHRGLFPAREVLVTMADDLPLVLAEATYLEQIVQNFMTNAHKYSPPGGPIELGVRATDETVEVRVRDHGAGVSDGDAKRLFTPFFRSADTATRVPGAGLGLAVCRRLAEVQGGTVWAQPAAGGGAEFVVALPAMRDDADQDPAADLPLPATIDLD